MVRDKRILINKTMKTLLKTVSFLLVFACLLFNNLEAARAADKTVDKSKLTILGLVIG